MNSSLYEPRLLCLFITNKLKSQHTCKYEIQLTSSDKKVLVESTEAHISFTYYLLHTFLNKFLHMITKL